MKNQFQIIQAFFPHANEVTIEPILGGLINTTFSVQILKEQQCKNYVLQQINTAIFENPKAIQANISSVSHYLKSKKYPHPILELCHTLEGETETIYDGGTWRLFKQIENSYTINVVQNPEQAHAVGAFFGHFHTFLNGIELRQIQAVLPHFLDTKSRLDAFQLALHSADSSRLTEADESIQWMVKHLD
ncbi:MAG: hypothetical protein RLZZ231_1072, partial [Bacteroidota bacterium]